MTDPGSAGSPPLFSPWEQETILFPMVRPPKCTQPVPRIAKKDWYRIKPAMKSAGPLVRAVTDLLQDRYVPGPHQGKLPTGLHCLSAPKSCCYHFTDAEMARASRRGKAYRRWMQRQTRGLANPMAR